MDKKHFLILLASMVLTIFLSVFFSFWFFFGHHLKPRPNHFAVAMIPNPALTNDMNASLEEVNKMMESQQKIIDKMNRDFANPMVEGPNHSVFINDNMFNPQNSVSITSEEFKNQYKITINLKPFNNNEKNIKVDVKDNTVTISADYKSENKKKYSSSQLYQTFALASKINAKEIKKEKKGDLLIITIPKIK